MTFMLVVTALNIRFVDQEQKAKKLAGGIGTSSSDIDLQGSPKYRLIILAFLSSLPCSIISIGNSFTFNPLQKAFGAR